MGVNNREDLIEEFLDEQKTSEPVNEQEDDEEVKNVIEDLSNTDFSSNEDQGKFSELIKGLSFSENELATEFIAEFQDRADDVAESIGVEV